jgi:hypothetical protein
MDEQIDKQLENAQPKGPFWISKYLRYLSWDRVIGVLMIGAIIVYAKSGKPAKVMGPQKPAVKQEIVKQETVEQSAGNQAVTARYQEGTSYRTISSQQGYEQQYERTEPATPAANASGGYQGSEAGKDPERRICFEYCSGGSG